MQVSRRPGATISPCQVNTFFVAPGQFFNSEGTMHPTREMLSALASDTLAPEERTVVLAHVAQCGSCREFLTLIAPEEGPPAPLVRSTAKKVA